MLARRVVLRQASQKAGARRRREAASAEVVRLAQKGEHGRAVALAASAGADRRAWRSVLSSLRTSAAAASKASKRGVGGPAATQAALAARALAEMGKQGLGPSARDATAAMSCCLQCGAPEEAVRVFEAWEPRVDGDARFYNAALRAALAVGGGGGGGGVLGAMEAAGVPRDRWTYAHLARGLAAEGDAAGVERLIAELPAEEAAMAMTKNALVQAHVAAGDADGALEAALEVFPDGERTEETGRLLREAFRHSSSMQDSGQEKGAKFPTSRAPISVVFHSFWLIFGRVIISRNGLEA